MRVPRVDREQPVQHVRLTDVQLPRHKEGILPRYITQRKAQEGKEDVLLAETRPVAAAQYLSAHGVHSPCEWRVCMSCQL